MLLAMLVVWVLTQTHGKALHFLQQEQGDLLQVLQHLQGLVWQTWHLSHGNFLQLRQQAHC